jgi:hypothetical protein
MAEDHSKYMPHHPKPKFADKGKPSLKDNALRKRGEETGHAGSGDGASAGSNNYGSYEEG